MATDQAFVDYVMEQAGLGSRIQFKKMFGEYGVYLDDKVVAFACDNSLFLKPNPAADRLVPNAPKRPPYPGAKDYPVLDEWLDDAETLRTLLLASAEALPAPKAKARKAPIGKQPRADSSASNTSAKKKSTANKTALNKASAQASKPTTTIAKQSGAKKSPAKQSAATKSVRKPKSS